MDPSKKKKRKKKNKCEDATYDSEPDYGYAEVFSLISCCLRFSVMLFLWIMIPGSFCMYAIAVQLLSRVFDMLREEVSTERPRTVMMRHPQLLAQGTQITICLDFAHLCTTYDPPCFFVS